MDAAGAVRRLAGAETAAHCAITLLAPELAPLVQAVGVRGALSLMLVLGGKRVRIPRAEDALKALEIVPAALEVVGGAGPEAVARRTGIPPHRLRTVAEAVRRQLRRQGIEPPPPP